MERELDFLKFFYEQIEASSDERQARLNSFIKRAYVMETGNALPKGYKLEEI